ncbi:hypothetical protein AB1E33_25655 [Ruegeria sp. 2012CJ15-1]|uniref:hypothetical protein n=1 Tax=Ruegeria hyattellae TaxID=3233337 RepID=UPI00355B940C
MKERDRQEQQQHGGHHGHQQDAERLRLSDPIEKVYKFIMRQTRPMLASNVLASTAATLAAIEAVDTGVVMIDGKLIEKPGLRDMHFIVANVDWMGNA